MSTTQDMGRNEVTQPSALLPNEAVQPSRPVDATARGSSKEIVFLYRLVAGIIAFLLGALVWYGMTVSDTYQGIRDSVPEHSPAILLGIARAQSFDLTKGGVQACCFVVVLVGALLVIYKNVEGSFRFDVQHAQGRSALRTSSPGLVLVTLGLGVPVLMSYTPSQVNLQFESSKESVQTIGSTSSSQVPYVFARDAAPSPWLSLLPERQASSPYDMWMPRDQEPTTPAPGSASTPSGSTR